ncbi:hypothetical protein CDL12_29469 [Handroanthus impetiginosus]|uniref:ZF-HD dimerization-type domain-containing protein n=1 Tax=Handroanthus impetiginosus TaxID=429701 RepID=A0A2G9FYB1_9LAMI|nr:hypothetical protein CDL12_29674 [Handroanthus impetiginosus]PIM98052.1 hypothetical protein CDL12_29469 [Handroanthus impetiginosus]
MGDYAECHKSHPHNRGKTDGCQEFMEDWIDPMECKVCGCHRNFHRKVKPPVKYKTVVVYTKCHKIHDFKFQNSVDGCQEFIPVGKVGEVALVCATCGCNKGFHRNEVTTQVTST